MYTAHSGGAHYIHPTPSKWVVLSVLLGVSGNFSALLLALVRRLAIKQRGVEETTSRAYILFMSKRDWCTTVARSERCEPFAAPFVY